MELQDYVGAIPDFDEAARRDFKDATAAYLWRGQAKKELGDWAGAITDYTEYLRYYPDTAIAYHGRATAKEQLDDYAGAKHDWQKALALAEAKDDSELARSVLQKLAELEGLTLIFS